MTPDAAARTARGVLEKWRSRAYMRRSEDEANDDLRDLIAAALVEARADAVAQYARTVDDPARAHLHYDGCPFKPYQSTAEWDMPEPRPECTCAQEHLAAYWKGQHMLERSARTLEVREARRAALEEAARVAEAPVYCGKMCGHVEHSGMRQAAAAIRRLGSGDAT